MAHAKLPPRPRRNYALRDSLESSHRTSPLSMPSTQLPNACAVLVAAGESTRMGGVRANGSRKPLLQIAGRSLLELSCAAFDAAPSVRSIVLVAHRDDIATIESLTRRFATLRKVIAVVAGGAQRTDSVRLGVAAAPADAEVVLVHDAARPLIEPATIELAIETAFREGGALVATPINDTLKSAPDGTHSVATIDRNTVWAAQTPQAFRASVLRELLARAQAEGRSPTDDAALYEIYVGPIALVRGSSSNMKITVPEDLDIAEALLSRRVHKERA